LDVLTFYTFIQCSLNADDLSSGDPAQTGTATLTVNVLDVNDNYPTFKEDYRPVISEADPPTSRTVQLILAKDPDGPPYSDPFGFKMECPATNTDCTHFQFTFNESQLSCLLQY
jgi:hypothetical protein